MLLTVVLTLKGRALFTLRWLWYANQINFPYKILIADGEVSSFMRGICTDKSIFKNIDVEYYEYNDYNYSQYYFKFHDILSKVQTPYVMFQDNDDFSIVSGLEKDIQFLETHEDFVSVSGRVSGFSLNENCMSAVPLLSGTVDSWNKDYNVNYAPYRWDQNDAAARVNEMMLCYRPLYYNVFRRDVIQIVAEEIVALDFTNLEAHEIFLSARSLVFGKAARLEGHVSYLRQYNTSMLAGSPTQDWVDRLFSTKYTENFSKLFWYLAGTINSQDYNQQEEMVKIFSESYKENLRRKLKHLYSGENSTQRTFRNTINANLARLLPEKMVLALRQKLKGKQNGAVICEYDFLQRAEFQEIEKILNCGEFITYVENVSRKMEYEGDRN